MREKLLSLMKNENLTPSKLAELLGIQPSGISHILAGRNKPSFDLVQKILRRVPQINPDWLFLDQKPMYRQISENAISPSVQPTVNLFAESSEPRTESNGKHNAATNDFEPSVATNKSGVPTSVMQSVAAVSSQQKIRRIIILFDDHTFESFESPE